MEKITNDDYPSVVNEHYEMLIDNQELFEVKIIEMDENEIIEFYKYVQVKCLGIVDTEHRIWFVRSYLESLDIVQSYLNTPSTRQELTIEEEQSIEETIRVLEERRHPSPLKRLIKYFKGN